METVVRFYLIVLFLPWVTCSISLNSDFDGSSGPYMCCGAMVDLLVLRDNSRGVRVSLLTKAKITCKLEGES